MKCAIYINKHSWSLFFPLYNYLILLEITYFFLKLPFSPSLLSVFLCLFSSTFTPLVASPRLLLADKMGQLNIRSIKKPQQHNRWQTRLFDILRWCPLSVTQGGDKHHKINAHEKMGKISSQSSVLWISTERARHRNVSPVILLPIGPNSWDCG